VDQRQIVTRRLAKVITGALTGIGRATALAFAREGARMVVSGRRHQAGQALAAELRNLGAEAEFVRVDVRHDDEVRNLTNQTVARFGRLDVGVSNAGPEARPGNPKKATLPRSIPTLLGTLLSMKLAKQRGITARLDYIVRGLR
jgi:NAD(P)-dependent dehydrogenase (short-subunit alcohol dehydrogenase family)